MHINFNFFQGRQETNVYNLQLRHFCTFVKKKERLITKSVFQFMLDSQ